jgi:hypothetical protein
MVLSLITTNGDAVDDIAFFGTHKYINGPEEYGASEVDQKNVFTASDITALNVTDPAAPTDVEMGNVLLGGLSKMQTFVDYAGDLCNDNLKRVVVVTGDAAKHAAVVKAITNNVLAGGVQSPVAPLTIDGYQFRAVLEPSLTGTSMYMFSADSVIKPFITQETAMDFQALGPDSEYAKENLKVLFGVSTNRAAGYGRYQSAIKMTLS